MEFLSQIEKFISAQDMLQIGDGVVVGVSGGADSVCLLRVLVALREKYELKLASVHVNHMIRGQAADEDEAFVNELCDKWDVPFFTFRKDVPQLAEEWGMTEEEAGRRVRYQCFELVRLAEGLNKTAVAHHQEDLAETVLFQMVRGSLISGMVGMRPVRGRLIRPLLNVTRDDIEEYLRKEHLPFRVDASNLDMSYARNKIRHQVIPILKEINAGAVQHIAEISKNMGALDEEIKHEADKVPVQYDRIKGSERPTEAHLHIENIVSRNGMVQGEIIIRIIENLTGKRKDITRKHVADVLRLIQQESGSKVDLPYNLSARKNYTEIIIEQKLADASGVLKAKKSPGNLKMTVEDWSADGEILRREDAKQIDYDKITSTLQLRFPQMGDFIVTTQENGSKKLRALFTDLKIDRKERAYLPVVADGKEIVWIVGHRLSERYKITEETKKIALLEYTEAEEDTT